MLDYDKALKMARWMKKKDPEIQRAIRKTIKDEHGVVVLRFTDNAKYMEIEILDEPFEANVRVYAG